MSDRPSTIDVARAAITAATAAARVGAGSDDGALVDGRKQRWQRHKEIRRTDLVDGTLAAVREHGADVGMDEIGAHIGVSKAVLYRYFADKNDLNTAAMVRFIETILLPRLTEAFHDTSTDDTSTDDTDPDDHTLTRTVIAVYVDTIADEPEIYRFVTSARSAGAGVLADSEKLLADLVVFALHDRLAGRGLDTTCFRTWAYAVVGGVQLATHWWMQDAALSRATLVDHLTVLVWTSLVGMVRAGDATSRATSGPTSRPVASAVR